MSRTTGATSTCIKCSRMRFEAKEHVPNGSKFKLIFVQCAACGGVVGVIDFFNIGTILTKIADALKVKY